MAALISSLAAAATGAGALPPVGPSILEVGTTLQRKLEDPQEGVHVYRAELDAGAWRLVLTQYGADVTATVVSLGGQRLGPLDSPAGRRGEEAVLIVMDTAGTVGVEVRPGSSGSYEIRLEHLPESEVEAESAATAAALSYAADDKAQAHEQYREALSRWPPEAAAGRARTLVALANLGRSLGEGEQAVRHYREALALWRRLGQRDDEATTLNRLGLALDGLGRSAEARRLFEEAIAVWRQLGDLDAELPARMNLCLALQRQGAFAEARTCYDEAIVLLREAGDAERETVALSNLAGVHWKLGEPDRALELYNEVLGRSRAEGLSALEARTLSNRALLYDDLGEAEEALLDYGRALAVFRRLEDRRMEGTVLGNLGNAYLGLGELERSRTLLEQALCLHRDAGDRRGEVATLRFLGQVYARLEDWPKAFDAHGEALSSSLELEDRRGEATVRQLIGEAHATQGSLRRAELELEEAAELQHEIGDRHQEARALLELGKVHHHTGDDTAALMLFGQALETFRSLRDPGDQARVLEARARTQQDRGRTADALADATAAGALLEDLRTRAGGLRQRSAFLATRRGVYELHVDLLMARHREQPEAGYDRQAFAVSERAHSRALLDVIRPEARLGDSALSDRLRDAARRLSGLVERQAAILGQAREHDENEATAAEHDVYEALTELERLRAEARQSNPGYAGLTHEATLDVDQTRQLLDEGTLLLEFVLGEEHGFVWAMGRNVASTSLELPAGRELEALARQAHHDLSTLDLRTGRTSREALARLAEMLLAPLAEQLDAAERLVVVADGALHYVPFAALPWKDGSPLVASHEVVYLPSASALAEQRRRSAPSALKSIAVVADPVFDVLDPRLGGMRGTTVPPAEDPVRLRSGLSNLRRLPATRREAEAILALVPPSQSLLVSGFDAHRERVLGGELAAYRYLHFATHGLLSSENPELSGLVLSRLDAAGRSRNGFLGMDDVFALELNAELVVLSGCRTALGKEVRGEGLVGLASGFMAAGVPRVVASLWPVRDEATAELMMRFYRGMLEAEQPPAAALADAQRSMREERQWADPHFWAAFVLVGDWRQP